MTDRSRTQHRPCWTCRLRRKGCDAARPACGGCTVLGITCYSDDFKPSWMDGGARQREMARRIAAQIKDGASSRRQRHTRTAFVVVSPGHFAASRGEGSAASRSTRRPREGADAPQNPDGEPDAPSAAQSPPRASSPPAPLSSTLSPLGRAWELGATMTYIDHVFPFLFPFYRPSLLDTSRAWILSFVTLNGAVSHSVLSLSSFFIAVGLKECHPDRAPCNSVIWSQVVGQAEKSFEMIRKDLAEVAREGTTASLLDKVHMMETIIQLLVFELFVGGSSGAAWQAHLTPAVALFEDILTSTRGVNGTMTKEDDSLTHVLDQMAWPPPSFPKLSERRLWNPDQAAFRFFAAVLLVLDILSGVALRRAPRLHRYHAHLLPEIEPEENTAPLALSCFIGCENWVLRAISDTAALDEWKQTQREAGTFSQAEMAQRASAVHQLLTLGLARLDIDENTEANTVDPLRQHLSTPARPSSATIRIWAHAARLYLSVTVSGWTPSDPRVTHDVAQVLWLLAAVPSLSQLRACAWPLCVAGCLAQPGAAREAFEAVIRRTRGSQLLGGLRDVEKIVAAVWALQKDDGWDVAGCLGVLGTPALLF
ncbi:hypothetical protein CONLIGDRAFT_502492 [Coniochaeta ligniaria NRRL 30616]|uniref:Zn(2)-C6 fungal-type domain-containing protein n=1 Tax=Coniochaeta ligniaria NRRL 30616 TaxID=1408157 RepID=A0A1J7IE36_9PEZI|nr:hypothetical protein CONLIGDRAFT_502492 [Coniochaeta ligniaria NRRL 30616]